MYIFSNTNLTNLKELIGNKSFNTKQCPEGVSPRLISLDLYGESWGSGRIPANSQMFTHFPTKKSSLINLHLPLSIVSFLCHQIAIFIKSSYANFICSCNHCCCIIFLTSGFMYTHAMPVLINRCLLNVVFSMTKALNSQSSPKQHFCSPYLSMLVGKPCFS